MTQQTGRKSRLGQAGVTTSSVLLNVVFIWGAHILEDLQILPRREAYLVSLLIAGVLLLVIPSKDPIAARPMIFNLIAVVAGYGILEKLYPWLVQLTNPRLAIVISIVLTLSVALVLQAFFRPRARLRPASD